MAEMLSACANTKSEEYMKCLIDWSLKDQRYLLDFFPPTTQSSLVTVNYVLQVYVDFKGMNLSGKKPIEEVKLEFQCARDGGLVWKDQQDAKERKPLRDWAPMRNKNTDVDWTKSTEKEVLAKTQSQTAA